MSEFAWVARGGETQVGLRRSPRERGTMSNVAAAGLDALLRPDLLPSLPAVALEVIELTQQDDPDLSQVADAVGRDPVLAGRLVRLSNSPLFGRSREVASIHQALLVLGLKTVKMAAVSLSMSAALGPARFGMGRKEDFDGFWRRSVTSAVTARQILQRTHPRLADEGFLGGLLMDVGVACLLQSEHEPYRAVLPTLRAGHPDFRVEPEALAGFDHAAVSAHILQSWSLPELLVEAVSAHHQSSSDFDASPEILALARALNLAHDIGTVLASDEARGEALITAQSKARDWFQMDEGEFKALTDELVAHVASMADMMSVDVGTPDQMALTLLQAQEEMLATAVGASRRLEEAQSQVAELQTEAATDALTRLPNRGSYDRALAKALAGHQVGKPADPFGLILCDVDRFKSVNDTHGHGVGDEVLCHVARVLSKACRQGDRVFRYGGEEFAVLVATSSAEQLGAVTERLRAALEDAVAETRVGPLRVTASFGGIWLPFVSPGIHAEHVLTCADKNMYAAKQAGRNRCVVSTLDDDAEG